MDEIGVTAHTILLDDHLIARRDLDRLVKILQRKALGVPKPVFGLGVILADKVVRQLREKYPNYAGG